MSDLLACITWGYIYLGTLPDGREVWHWGIGLRGQVRKLPVLRAEDV